MLRVHFVNSHNRLKLKNYLTPGKAAKKGGAAVEVEPPTHATIYVAKSYPAWQCIILDTLRYTCPPMPPSTWPSPTQPRSASNWTHSGIHAHPCHYLHGQVLSSLAVRHTGYTLVLMPTHAAINVAKSYPAWQCKTPYWISVGLLMCFDGRNAHPCQYLRCQFLPSAQPVKCSF
jgi:hypothetical protein